MDYFLDINGKSKHINESRDLNESNYGFGITAEEAKDNVVKALSGGAYNNSYSDPSYYLAGSLAKRFGDEYYADLGVAGGAVTGYDKKISPMAALMMNLGKKDLARLKLMYAPPSEKTGALMMMNLGIPFR